MIQVPKAHCSINAQSHSRIGFPGNIDRCQFQASDESLRHNPVLPAVNQMAHDRSAPGIAEVCIIPKQLWDGVLSGTCTRPDECLPANDHL
jgi:hypothetical protein